MDTYFLCALRSKILVQGRLYLFQNTLAFYSNLFGYVTKLKMARACDCLKRESENNHAAAAASSCSSPSPRPRSSSAHFLLSPLPLLVFPFSSPAALPGHRGCPKAPPEHPRRRRHRDRLQRCAAGGAAPRRCSSLTAAASSSLFGGPPLVIFLKPRHVLLAPPPVAFRAFFSAGETHTFASFWDREDALERIRAAWLRATTVPPSRRAALQAAALLFRMNNRHRCSLCRVCPLARLPALCGERPAESTSSSSPVPAALLLVSSMLREDEFLDELKKDIKQLAGAESPRTPSIAASARPPLDSSDSAAAASSVGFSVESSSRGDLGGTAAGAEQAAAAAAGPGGEEAAAAGVTEFQGYCFPGPPSIYSASPRPSPKKPHGPATGVGQPATQRQSSLVSFICGAPTTRVVSDDDEETEPETTPTAASSSGRGGDAGAGAAAAEVSRSSSTPAASTAEQAAEADAGAERGKPKLRRAGSATTEGEQGRAAGGSNSAGGGGAAAVAKLPAGIPPLPTPKADEFERLVR